LIDSLQAESWSAAELIEWAVARYGREFAIATSFQKEGMVILDIASRIEPKVRVFTLDTGRLPAETHQMIETVRQRYGIAVEVVTPDQAEVESMVTAHGANLFYQSTEFRELCCNIRKVRPLERKLRELKAWAVGLRRSQSEARASTPKIDQNGAAVKLSPIADWTSEQIDAYIADQRVPVHPLYAAGYASIGCAPCTRPVQIGEDERSGRWWWEQDAKKECGIHITADGVVRRANLEEPAKHA
jgi:thioredoxin-dependent adenylylsulfate APS reductase